MSLKNFILSYFFASIMFLNIKNIYAVEDYVINNTISIKKIGTSTNQNVEITQLKTPISMGTVSIEYESEYLKKCIQDDQIIENIFNNINKNWKYPDKNTKPCETKSVSWFEKKIITQKGSISSILWNEKNQPSFREALNEILNKPLILECANAAKFCRLKLITDLLGDEGTQKIICDIKKTYETSSFDFLNQLSWKFFEKEEGEMKSGKIYFFPFVNHKIYTEINPTGSNANLNAVRLFDGNYLGFSPDFFKTSKSFKEMELFLFSELTNNKKIIDFSIFQKERSEYQNNIGYFYLNLEKLAYFKIHGKFMI